MIAKIKGDTGDLTDASSELAGISEQLNSAAEDLGTG